MELAAAEKNPDAIFWFLVSGFWFLRGMKRDRSQLLTV
jgi:hypothetical protein